MPRIPTRTTPYETPTRQHRHFKNKRDQVLRALGRSSYINGSQFAIMWVSARGETETYASPVLQSLMDSEPGKPKLFSSEILQRAKEAAAKAPHELKVSEMCLEHLELTGRPLSPRTQTLGHGENAFTSPLSHGARDDMSEVSRENSLRDLSDTGEANTRMSMPAPAEERNNEAQKVVALESDNSSAFIRQMIADKQRSRDDLQDEIVPQIVPNQEFDNTRLVESVPSQTSCQTDSPRIVSFPTPLSMIADNQRSREDLQDENVSQIVPDQEFDNIRLIESLPSQTSCQTDSPRIVSFPTPLSLADFLEDKFRQLQQSTCKLVCKAWIKVVEPKKQRNFPYRSGETSKPEWWPPGVKHREPDHLLKPERIRLMLAVLGSGKVSVGRLELASAEMAAFIPADKMGILKDIYTVAKEEERLRCTWPAGVNFVPFQVELSAISSEGASKSSGSPRNLNAETATNSPKTKQYPTEVQSNERILKFEDNLLFQEKKSDPCLPRMIPEYLKNIETEPLTLTKATGFLNEQYNSYVNEMVTDCQKPWAVNQDMFQGSSETSLQMKRLDGSNSGFMESTESTTSGNPATYNFPMSFQPTLPREFIPSSLDVDENRDFQNPHLQTSDALFTLEASSTDSIAWRNCEDFIGNNMQNYCDENLWGNTVSYPPSLQFQRSLSSLFCQAEDSRT